MSWDTSGWRVRSFNDRDKTGSVESGDIKSITVRWDSGEVITYPKPNDDIMLIPPDDIANELQEKLDALMTLDKEIDRLYDQLKEELTAPLN